MILYTDEKDTMFTLDFFEKLTNTVFNEIKYNDHIEISLLLTDDETIQELNKNYRNKDNPTDVLSFPMDDDKILGDIVISVDTAYKQASEVDIDIEREVAFLYIHGLLHLLGYDHETSIEDEKEMFELQERILKKLVDAGQVK